MPNGACYRYGRKVRFDVCFEGERHETAIRIYQYLLSQSRPDLHSHQACSTWRMNRGICRHIRFAACASSSNSKIFAERRHCCCTFKLRAYESLKPWNCTLKTTSIAYDLTASRLPHRGNHFSTRNIQEKGKRNHIDPVCRYYSCFLQRQLLPVL